MSDGPLSYRSKLLALFGAAAIAVLFIFQNCGPAKMGTMGGADDGSNAAAVNPTPTPTPVVIPTPNPNQKVVVLTSGASWTVPSTVTKLDKVEVWGGGGGTRTDATGQSYGAAGGGAYSRITNFAVNPSSVINISIGTGGISSTTANGTGGGDTWFFSATTVLAKGGLAGTSSFSGSAGGSAATGIGEIKFDGGRGGDANGLGGPGGGAAASPAGQGIKGGDSSVSTIDGALGGSSPGAGLGGPGSNGATTPVNAQPGANNANGGGGGGGGGAQNAGQNVPTGSPAGGGGAGGFPGGGAGSTGALSGTATGTSTKSGNGAGGQIVITYTE